MKAFNIVDRINSIKQHKLDGSARDGARTYGHRITEAITILQDFDDRRLPTLDDLKSMRQTLADNGVPCTVLTLQNGLSCLVNIDGGLIASYLPEVQP